MRILLSAMIINLVDLEVIGVLDEQLHRLSTCFTLAQFVAQHARTEAPSIYSDEFHPRPNSGHSGWRAFNRVDYSSVGFQQQPYRIRSVYWLLHRGVVVSVFRSLQHLGARIVVHQSPAAAFNASERRTGSVVLQALRPEAAPIEGRNLIQ